MTNELIEGMAKAMCRSTCKNEVCECPAEDMKFYRIEAETMLAYLAANPTPEMVEAMIGVQRPNFEFLSPNLQASVREKARAALSAALTQAAKEK